MAENSSIEWCDHTFNPFIGCTKVSPGCDHCYAETLMDTRLHKVVWGSRGERVRTSVKNWGDPLKWNAAHDKFFATHGRRQSVFCASLADVFDNAIDPAWRRDLFELIASTPNLDCLLLTKRIGNVADMIADALLQPKGVNHHAPWPWPHVGLGATFVNQDELDRDIHKLLGTPAAMHFVSLEPLLGPIDLEDDLHFEYPRCDGYVPSTRYEAGYCDNCAGHVTDPIHTAPLGKIDWVIVGGESGLHARPMHPDWVRSLRDQCDAAGTPFLFKQWGAWHTDAYLMGSGVPVFRQFTNYQQWVNKASTWIHGGTCLDRHGRELRTGTDFMRARDSRDFPVTIMHRAGRAGTGRLLDGRTHDEFPRGLA